MAHSKQTAKKSTGGSAKRRILTPRVVLPPNASRSPSATPDVEMADELDSSTPNAGELLSSLVASSMQAASDATGDGAEDVSDYRRRISQFKLPPSDVSDSGVISAMMEAKHSSSVTTVGRQLANCAFQTSELCRTHCWKNVYSSVLGVVRRGMSFM